VARRDLVTPTGVFYYFSDHLKTASVITDSAGVIKAESDYYPWGGELQFVDADSNHYKFTGKERDGESGLDYSGARYYSNRLGRFITPDWAAKAAAVPYAEFSDPQSLNLYTYVRNIPTTRFDADGHDGLWNAAIKWWNELTQPLMDTNASKGDQPPIENDANPVAGTSPHALVDDTSQKLSSAIEVMNNVTVAADPTGQAAVLQSRLNGDNVGVALAAAGPLLGTLGKAEKAAQESVTAYQIIKDGKVAYVGITNNIARRSAEHGEVLQTVATLPSRSQARAVEQALIEHYGLEKNGGGAEQ
jgi:RHS repeat-associated protein